MSYWILYCLSEAHFAIFVSAEHGKLIVFGINNWGQLGVGSKLTVNKPTCVKGWSLTLCCVVHL